MGVRDEDGVDRLVRPRLGGRPEPAERAEPVAQDRVGQEPQAVELEEDGRVADEGESIAQNPPQSRRFPETVRPASEAVGWPLARMALLMAAAVAPALVLA